MADSSPLLCQSDGATTSSSESEGSPHDDIEKVASTSSLDDIFEQSLGGLSWSQVLQAVLVSLASILDSQQSFLSVYTDGEPTWHCTNNTTCNPITSNICQLSRSDWAWNAASKTIISEWGLECSSAFIKGLPSSSHFMGCLLGTISLATLADSSLGRKNLLLLSCLAVSITTSVTTLSNNVWIYSFLRFLTGFSRSSIDTCTIVLVTEKVGRKWRGRFGVLDCFFFVLGTLSLPAIAYVNRESSWRSIYLSISIPSSIKNLFHTRWARQRIMAIMVLSFGIGLVYYGETLGVGNLDFDIYLSVLFNGLLEIPALLFSLVLIEKWNRKISLLITCILCGIFSTMTILPSNGQEGLQIGLELVSFFGACTAYNVILIYAVELFPTSVRSFASSTVRQAISFGATLSSVLNSAGRSNQFLSYGVFGFVIICSGLCVIFLPDTRGAALCDTLDEQEDNDNLVV